MALSKVMTSSTSANSDLTRQPSSLYSLTAAEFQSSSVSSSSSCTIDPTKAFGSMSMDDILRNIYADSSHPTAEILPPPHDPDAGPCPLSRQGSFSLPKSVAAGSVDEVWKEISVADRRISDGLAFKDAAAFEEMTLEDFLAKAGAVREEDVRVPSGPASTGQGGFGGDSVLGSQFQPQQQVAEGSSVLGFGNGVEGGGGGGGGRGKRRAVQEPVDRVAQQRQRRMIKNRESAARSRERKQAYTVELESLVMQLEEENARLLRQQAEQTKKRLQQCSKDADIHWKQVEDAQSDFTCS
ncbi:ABSCISIC ACID-INSENSITIVE 5-like protein 5 isoform X2 [Magnolia sinica]|uniref:ABSCISIC ACID-INSENSITIVE 5-like protein 5 isoform X2 n=1 Tax=Magnolia sinica TaxID=86752 RepID=UPI0026582467|nr:ABSCISIC ACID-INSENSITIVE 5-like protein 5 isoform X2 [Magnolia sinica]